MIREASESKTSSQPPSPPAEAVTCLAPGFRFHPTDEELISYYLKRKITGRPIRADAISEIDLYRAEPWDLPPRSRLRSRDLEWYFFTSLDRKYSNRCRTNRATAEGYWKTTGKDRPVQRGSRTIGMKKTLVYHAGRAPRGQRTNWVMHEYRLEDEELARAGILQDGYVLCRVFQKNGSGPQNGAQYGAPYIEEEWEREEVDGANFVPVNVDRDELMDPAAQDFVQLGDFIQDPDSGIQHVDDFPSEAEATSDNQAEDSSIYIEDILKDIESSDDLPQEEGYSISHDSTTSFERLGKRNVLEESSNYASMQNKGCVQLKDMFNGDVEGNSINNNGDTDQLEQFQRLPAFEHQMFPQPFGPSDCAPWECSSGQFSEDNLVFYDALSHEIPCSKDGFTFESSLSPLSEVELSEDLMSFYDTTIDCPLYAPPNQFLPQFSPLDSSEWIPSNPSPEVVGSSNSYSKEVFHVPENFPKLSSFGISGPSTGRSDTESEDTKPEDCKDKTLTKRLASMLHSIPAPPAFANETGLVGKTAAQTPAASGSAFRLTAGMIQISNWTAMGSAESWTLQKHSELGFFAYGLSDSTISKVVDREQRSKLLSGFYSTFCRGGFHTLFLSAALLALSYKIAVYVCHL